MSRRCVLLVPLPAWDYGERRFAGRRGFGVYAGSGLASVAGSEACWSSGWASGESVGLFFSEEEGSEEGAASGGCGSLQAEGG